MHINKYGLSRKGQYAKEWLKTYWYIVLACILVALFVKVFSPPKSPFGCTPLLAGGYLRTPSDGPGAHDDGRLAPPLSDAPARFYSTNDWRAQALWPEVK